MKKEISYNIMKNWIIKIAFGVSFVGLFFACSEDFLNAPPQGALDEGTLSNKAGVEASLISAYSVLDGWANTWGLGAPWPQAGSNWVFGSVTSDDAYKGSEPGDQGEITSIELFQWTPQLSYFNAKFRILYEGIARANATNKLLAKASDISPEDQARIQGEVAFLRAHYHFDGWKMWGNIPYMTEEDTDFKKPNTEDIAPRILADLDLAISLLPESQADIGRVNKSTAQAYKARVLLHNGDYAGAKPLLDGVVNSGRYSLSPCFQDQWTSGGENGPEMMLSIQSSVNDGDSGGNNANFADRLNHPHGGSPYGCCGFHQPSQNLVNAYRVDASGLPLLDTFNDADVDETASAADVVDPRLDWTIGRDGVPFLNSANGVHAPEWIRSRSWAGPYSPKKFVGLVSEASNVGWVSAQLGGINIPILRYADVLLMLAECEVEIGSLERARELVNIVRARAAGCAQGPDGPTALDDAGITWATYSVGTYDAAWTNQAVARQAVRMERRLELALEGHRFFDLKRYGTAKEVINRYQDVEKTKRTYMQAGNNFEDKHMLFPIPFTQIELSKADGVATLQQNPGW